MIQVTEWKSRGTQEADVSLPRVHWWPKENGPCIERVRLKIGRASPNTVSPMLERWFATLDARLVSVQAGSGRSAGNDADSMPVGVHNAAKLLWETARREAEEVQRGELGSVRSEPQAREDALAEAEGLLAQREEAFTQAPGEPGCGAGLLAEAAQSAELAQTRGEARQRRPQTRLRLCCNVSGEEKASHEATRRMLEAALQRGAQSDERAAPRQSKRPHSGHEEKLERLGWQGALGERERVREKRAQGAGCKRRSNAKRLSSGLRIVTTESPVSESVNGDVGAFQLAEAYQILRQRAQKQFWQFAAKNVTAGPIPRGTPRANGSPYDSLCAAVEEVERKITARPTSTFVPRTPRRLSTDELQKAILRTKERLFKSEFAKAPLEVAYCNWVQAEYAKPLVAILRALDCECDERGSMVGSIPVSDPEFGAARLGALRGKFATPELVVACSGLMVSSSKWVFLATALGQLVAKGAQEASAKEQATSTTGAKEENGENRPESQPEPEDVAALETRSPAVTLLEQGTTSILDTLLDDEKLSQLREKMRLLSALLESSAEQLKNGVYVAPNSAAAVWDDVRQSFEAFRDAHSPTATSVQDIEAALARKSVRERCAARIARLQNISDGFDSNGDNLQDVRSLAASIYSSLVAGEIDADDGKVEGALALLQLIEGSQRQSSHDAFSSFTEASAVFGQKVAFNASLRKLSLREDHVQSEPIFVGNLTPMLESAEHELTSSATPEIEASTEGESLLSKVDAAPAAGPDQTNETRPTIEAVPGGDEVGAASSSEPSARSEPVHPERGNGEAIDPSLDVAIETDSEEIAASRVIDRRGPSVEEAERLCTFSEFCDQNWIDSFGRAAPAPWTSPTFVPSICERASASWDSSHQWLAYLLAATATADELNCNLDTDELSTASRLLSDPESYVLPRKPGRIGRLRSQPADSSLRTDAVSLTLEALAPNLPFQLSSSEVDQLVVEARYDAPGLATIVRFLLLGWSAATDPVQLLRLQLDHLGSDQPAALEQSLSAAQKRLQGIVTALYSAAGGRIQRRHCRKAWAEFITRHVVPLRAQLAPLPNERSRTNLTTAQATEMAVDLLHAFKRIMDSEGVKHQDLSAAVSAAEQIVSAIQDVVDARSKIEQSNKRPPKSVGAIPTDELSQLIADLPSGGSDRVCALVLRAGLTRMPQRNPLLIPGGLLVQYPDLLRMIRPDAIASPSLHLGVNVSAITELRGAVAVLADAANAEPEEVESTSSLLTSLRDRAVDLGRVDLLSALSSTDVLQSHERTQLHRKSLELGDEAYDLTRQLEKSWLDCDELVHPDAAKFAIVAKDALSTCAGGTDELNPSRAILIVEWLKAQVRVVQRERDNIITTRIDQANDRGTDIGREFEAHSRSGNHRAAMALLNPAIAAAESELGVIRKTMWRRDAIELFKQPTLTLTKELKGSNPDQSLLVGSWAEAARNPGFPDRDSIRKAFYAVISGEAGRSQAENQRRFAVKLTDLRDHPHRKTVVNCSVIREYFKRARLNPTFLPQLADYRQIVIVSTGIGQPGNALDVISRSIAQEGAGTLCVFLEPGLSLPKRDDLCAGLRRRNLPAAVIDDVDACRLCSIANDIEAHNFIPFLEIVFEQLDLEMVSPFSSLDGQHVRMETFIGRSQQASRIALSSDYTRIFSGRKLGKSAFLRYVTSTFDGSKLPSGNTLNVIFITIAGGESEAWVVDCIINEMANRFQLLGEMEQSTRLAPPDRFSRYADRFHRAKPTENVLLILDEADAFVEGQLKAYDDDREGSLSFRMMKELPTRVDSAGMPRIRIVFSGYRVTNTRGGVWANAGDVLILKPLSEDEAVEFLRGMLGRIGLEVGSHAPFVARRCGYQPAVLIRFGESLLRRVKRNSRSRRESYVVSYDDVLATMNEQAVMDEIRTVVTNNFQGNRAAAAIFGATLLALKDLEPGMSLDEGPSQVLSKIAEIDPDLDWLARYGPQPLSQIERQLQEFIDRELLTVSDAPRFGVREYRLKFPHFLPVLTQQTEVANEVRLHIKHLRADNQARQYIESILPDASLDEVRFWHRQEDAEGCSLVVIGSQWSASLTDPKIGIADRLGCNPPSVTRMGEGSNCVDQFDDRRQVFTEVSEQNWSSFLSRSHTRPLTLIGGIDLQRCARANFFGDDPRAIEPIRVGRIPEATVAWWFEVARALHFTSANSMARVWEATSGVPLLVGALDELLPNQLASDVSEAELTDALRMLNERLPDLAQQLRTGPKAIRLNARELELLQMAYHVGKEVETNFDLANEFPGHWDLCADILDKGWRAPMTDKDDNIALLVLLDAGLLAQPTQASPKGTSALGRVEVDAGGVVARLVKLMELPVAG